MTGEQFLRLTTFWTVIFLFTFVMWETIGAKQTLAAFIIAFILTLILWMSIKRRRGVKK